MGFKLVFTENNTRIDLLELSETQQDRYNALKARYEGKIYNTREEFVAAHKEATAELQKIMGDPVFRSNFRYGSHTLTQLVSGLDNMINSTADETEQVKWGALKEKLLDIMARGTEKSDNMTEWPVTINMPTDENSKIATIYDEELEKEVSDFIKEVNDLAQSELKESDEYRSIDEIVSDRVEKIKSGESAEGFDVNGFRRNNLLILKLYTDYAADYHPDAENSQRDDYVMVNSLGGFIPGLSEYGKGPRKSDEKYVSDYVRANGLLPFAEMPVLAIDTVKKLRDYNAKAAAGQATMEDELNIRRNILANTTAEMYKLDKIRKNINNREVNALFPRGEVPAKMDIVGDRNFGHYYTAMNTFRRQIISNGWPMKDVEAFGKAVYAGMKMREYVEKSDKEWAEYDEKLKEFNENKTDERPREPEKHRISEEERERVERYAAKLEVAGDSIPGNAERRKEILDSLAGEIGGFSEEEKDRYSTLADVESLFKACSEYKLNDMEINLITDPGSLKSMAQEYPIREYTEEEQRRDIQHFANEMERDKELNDIFKTDPWAYDTIRSLQDLAGSEEAFITAVKEAVGEEAFKEFKGNEGREEDKFKALDILTSKDSPYNVSADHSILENVHNKIKVRIRKQIGVLNDEVYRKGGFIRKQTENIADAKRELERMKQSGIRVEPYVLDELSAFLDKKRDVPEWEQTSNDAEYLEKAERFIKENSEADHLDDYIKAIREKRETTLAARTNFQQAIAVEKIDRMLKSTDSFFHSDSAQFKEVRKDLKNYYAVQLSVEQRQAAKEKLTADVKKWLTDPKYDRINKHNKNQFDNTRFNYMFTLANELDPEWAKENFSRMKLSAFHGDKASQSEFYNVYDFLGFTHKQIINAHYTDHYSKRNEEYGSVYAKKMLWFKKMNESGEKALVEEAERIRKDDSYAARDRLSVERDNLNKLTGRGEDMKMDLAFNQKFSFVDAYCQRIGNLVESNQVVTEAMEKTNLKGVRENAVNQVKEFVEDPQNEKDPLYKKALAAYGVMDPRGAHDYMEGFNARHAKDKKVKPVSLMDLEKDQNLDIGARKDYNRKMAEKRQTEKKQRFFM